VREPGRADPHPALTVRPRLGFSLVEILVTVVIFSVVILSLSGLAYRIAKSGTHASDQTLTMSVLLARVDRASMINYDSLRTIAKCDTTTSGIVEVYACIRVDSVSNVRRRATVSVWTSIAGSRPDTVVFERARVRYPIPLK
jgi:prepilin-type N-terminal cleavage/methylation domain-containing protein